jgi:ATP-dependent Clp protease protease subunit
MSTHRSLIKLPPAHASAAAPAARPKPARARAGGRPDFRIQNATGDAAEVYIYDEIAWYGVSAQDIVDELKAITAPLIHLRINSAGGDVMDGIAIYNAFARHPAKVISHVDGLAASAASIIALAGDEVEMSEGAFVMIHSAWAFAMGNATEMRRMSQLLDAVDGSLAGIYARRMGIAAAEALSLMEEETWLSADQAVAQGFADRMEERTAVEASFDPSMFQHVPEEVRIAARGSAPRGSRSGNRPETIRDFEELLRDAGGFSHAEARRIAASGYKSQATPRDERAPALDLSPLASLASDIRSLTTR